MLKTWWKESVVYQIYPRSFYDSNGDGIGDIPGIIKKLDYLKKLGIDVLWLSPVYQSPNDDNGYDISNYYKIMDDFGDMDDFNQLLKEVHKRNMKLIMDLVVNHTSDEHLWFQEARKSKNNPYRDYYIWRSGKNDREPNNWESNFSGSTWTYDDITNEYYFHLFSKKQPDLNWENPQLRQEIYQMMKWWLDKGIDGFRMDVINLISKQPSLPDAPNPENKKYVSGDMYYMNGPRVHEFLQEMYKEVLSKYDVMTVGETPGVDVHEAEKYTGNHREELQMVFQFEHMDLDSGPESKWNLKPLKLTDLKDNLTKWQKGLQNSGWNSLYLNNHDQPRMVSRFGDDKNYREESAKMLATLLHMMQGTPFIYQGEEIAMTNAYFPNINDYKDIETLNMYEEKVVEQEKNPEKVMEAIHAKGRDNARTPFQWDDCKHAGFTTGVPWIKVNQNYKHINAQKNINDKQSVYYYYQKLIQLRKQYDIIVYGDYELIDPSNESIFAYLRKYKNEKLLVITNFTDKYVNFNMPNNFEAKEKLISNYLNINDKTQKVLKLRPFEAIVFLDN